MPVMHRIAKLLGKLPQVSQSLLQIYGEFPRESQRNPLPLRHSVDLSLDHAVFLANFGDMVEEGGGYLPFANARLSAIHVDLEDVTRLLNRPNDPEDKAGCQEF